MELGQIMHGNPVGRYDTLPYQDALILNLLDEIDRVFWNKEQDAWNRYEDPKIEGVEFRSYYWGDQEEEAAKPNFKIVTSTQEIRWYKHPGRSMTVTENWEPEEWVKWYNEALSLILKADKHNW